MHTQYEHKRVLITGAGGFVGSHLVAALHRLKAKTYISASRSGYDLRESEDAKHLVSRAQIQLGQIDILFHLAGTVSGLHNTSRKPYEHFYDNAIMGLNILHAAFESGVRKVVVAGSVCAYPQHTHIPFVEANLWGGLPEPTNRYYGLAKRTVLAAQQALYAQNGYPSAHLLFANMYGPRDNFDPNTSHVIPALINKFLAAEPDGEVEIWGDGEATRDFLYVEDAVDALLRAGLVLRAPDPINIGYGAETSILQIAHLIAQYTGFRGELHYDLTKPTGQSRRLLNIDLAQRYLDWTPKTSVASGLKQTIAWRITQAPPPFMASAAERQENP